MLRQPAVCCSVPSSGCLVLCLCLSVLTLLLQSLWVPLETTRDEAAGRSPEEHGTSHTHWHIWCSLGVEIPVFDRALYTLRGGSYHVCDRCGFAAKKEYRWSVQQSSKSSPQGEYSRGQQTGLFVQQKHSSWFTRRRCCQHSSQECVFL